MARKVADKDGYNAVVLGAVLKKSHKVFAVDETGFGECKSRAKSKQQVI